MGVALKGIRPLGRYQHEASGRSVNVKKGHNPKRGTDIYFYISSGKRIILGDAEFHREWKRLDAWDNKT